MNLKITKQQLSEKQTIVLVLGLTLIVLLSIWKAQFGLGGKDVAWYITLPYRTVYGDKLFFDELHPAQLFSVIFIPITKLFININGSSENIMIYSRYLCILVNTLLSLVVYKRLKQYGLWAVVVTWIYALYYPYNHTMLSYNSISVMVAFLGIILLATAVKKSDYFWAGFCYALATICQPLLGMVFIFASIAIIMISLIKKKNMLIKRWGIFTGACIITSIPVISYLIFYVGIKNIIKTMPLMNSILGNEHNYAHLVKSMLRNAIGPFLPKRIIVIQGISINTIYLSLLLYILLFIVMLCYFINRFSKNSRKVEQISTILLCVFATLQCIVYCVASTKTNSINFIWTAWLFAGVAAYFKQKNHIIKRLYLYSVVWGIIHSFGYITSNVGGVVFAVAWFPAAVFSILLFKNNEIIDRRIIKRIFVACLCISLLSATYVRITGLFWDQNVFSLTETIKKGPGKGLKVNKNDYWKYDSLHKELNCIEINKKNIVIVSERTWSYLFIDGKLAQPSMMWEHINERTINILKEYIRLKPEKKPDIIYVAKNELTEISLKKIISILGLKDYSIDNKKYGYIISIRNR